MPIMEMAVTRAVRPAIAAYAVLPPGQATGLAPRVTVAAC